MCESIVLSSSILHYVLFRKDLQVARFSRNCKNHMSAPQKIKNQKKITEYTRIVVFIHSSFLLWGEGVWDTSE